MMPYEDVHFQLVDLPAVSSEHPVPWLRATLQTADAALLVVDPRRASCVDAAGGPCTRSLRERRVSLTERWAGDRRRRHAPTSRSDGDPFAVRLPTLMLANKAERIADLAAELDTLRELAGIRYPMLAVSAATGRGLAEIGAVALRPSRHRPRLHEDCRASRPTSRGRSRCAAGRRCATSPGSCTRISRASCAMRASSVRPDSTPSRSVRITRSSMATSSSCTAEHRRASQLSPRGNTQP